MLQALATKIASITVRTNHQEDLDMSSAIHQITEDDYDKLADLLSTAKVTLHWD